MGDVWYSIVKKVAFLRDWSLVREAIRHAREAFEIRDPMSPFFFSKLHPASARLLADPRFHEMPVDMGWLSK